MFLLRLLVMSFAHSAAQPLAMHLEKMHSVSHVVTTAWTPGFHSASPWAGAYLTQAALQCPRCIAQILPKLQPVTGPVPLG